MSFSNNVRPDRMPGLISGNPLNGLCEKVCIQVNKVFDACLNQIQLNDYILEICDVDCSTCRSGCVPCPLTFVSGRSTTSHGIIRSYAITKLADSKLSRVQATIEIPVEVIFINSQNAECIGYGKIIVNEDVLMHVPANSVIPVELAATVSAIIAEGECSGPNQFRVTACVTVVLKVEAEVELLIPSYGYCFIPPCQPYAEDVCSGVFDMPLFPTTCK